MVFSFSFKSHQYIMTSHKFHKGQNSMRYSILFLFHRYSIHSRTCCSWVQEDSRKKFSLASHGAVSHQVSGLSAAWRMYTAILRYCGLKERPYSFSAVLVAASWCCLEIRENNFTFKCRSLYWSFGMAKERNTMFIKNISINSFLNINCLSVSLGPIKYAEEPPRHGPQQHKIDIAIERQGL